MPGSRTESQVASCFSSLSKLQTALRAGDVFARFGDDELVALLVGTTRENLIAVAERVRSAYAETDFAANRERLHTTVSVGIGDRYLVAT